MSTSRGVGSATTCGATRPVVSHAELGPAIASSGSSSSSAARARASQGSSRVSSTLVGSSRSTGNAAVVKSQQQPSERVVSFADDFEPSGSCQVSQRPYQPMTSQPLASGFGKPAPIPVPARRRSKDADGSPTESVVDAKCRPEKPVADKAAQPPRNLVPLDELYRRRHHGCLFKVGHFGCSRDWTEGSAYCAMHQCRSVLVDGTRCPNSTEFRSLFCTLHRVGHENQRLEELQQEINIRAWWIVQEREAKEQEAKESLSALRTLLRRADAQTLRDPTQPKLSWHDWLRQPVQQRAREGSSSEDERTVEEKASDDFLAELSGGASETDSPRSWHCSLPAEEVSVSVCHTDDANHDNVQARAGLAVETPSNGAIKDLIESVNSLASVSTLVNGTYSYQPSESGAEGHDGAPAALESSAVTQGSTSLPTVSTPVSSVYTAAASDELRTPHTSYSFGETPPSARALLHMLESVKSSPTADKGAHVLHMHTPERIKPLDFTTSSASSPAVKRAPRAFTRRTQHHHHRRPDSSRSTVKLPRRNVRMHVGSA